MTNLSILSAKSLITNFTLIRSRDMCVDKIVSRQLQPISKSNPTIFTDKRSDRIVKRGKVCVNSDYLMLAGVWLSAVRNDRWIHNRRCGIYNIADFSDNIIVIKVVFRS